MNQKKRKKTVKQICIDENYCKGCYLCIEQCPTAVYEISSKRNAKGYLVPEIARFEDCTGCMLCELTCPDMAITVEKEENEK